jgi:hypothetical protein
MLRLMMTILLVRFARSHYSLACIIIILENQRSVSDSHEQTIFLLFCSSGKLYPKLRAFALSLVFLIPRFTASFFVLSYYLSFTLFVTCYSCSANLLTLRRLLPIIFVLLIS